MANILLVARYADNRGGADVYTEGLAMRLAQSGHFVQLMCHDASERVRDLCTTIPVSEPSTGDKKIVWRFAPMFYQRHWRHAINRLSLNPDVIISSLPLSCRDLKRRFRAVPLVYLPHSRIAPVEATTSMNDIGVQKRFAASLYAKCERWSLCNADVTVRFTEGNVDQLRQHYDLPQSASLAVIPAPTETPEFPLPIEPKHHDGQPIQLLTAGRLVASKNLLHLLRILASLKSDQWQLTIAGDGPQRSQIESTAKELKIADRVVFAGHCNDMSSIYQSADLHLFPSVRESFGLVILEAMANGVPTLAFKPDGDSIDTASDEIIRHNVDGLLASGNEHFRQLLSRCMANRNDLHMLGLSGQEHVFQNHSWEHVMSIWESTLTQLTNHYSQTIEARANASEILWTTHV